MLKEKCSEMKSILKFYIFLTNEVNKDKTLVTKMELLKVLFSNNLNNNQSLNIVKSILFKIDFGDNSTIKVLIDAVKEI